MFFGSNWFIDDVFLVPADDHETDYEYEGSDNDEPVAQEGEPR